LRPEQGIAPNRELQGDLSGMLAENQQLGQKYLCEYNASGPCIGTSSSRSRDHLRTGLTRTKRAHPPSPARHKKCERTRSQMMSESTGQHRVGANDGSRSGHIFVPHLQRARCDLGPDPNTRHATTDCSHGVALAEPGQSPSLQPGPGAVLPLNPGADRQRSQAETPQDHIPAYKLRY
jgi:hypothetical protein